MDKLNEKEYLLTNYISSQPYFDKEYLLNKIDLNRYRKNKKKKLNVLVDKLDSLLNSAMKTESFDGVICSGGMDSSLITAIAKKQNPDLKVFSLDVEDCSEIRYARKVSSLHEIKFGKKEFLDNVDKATKAIGRPLIHANTVAIYHLCQEVSKTGTKSVLSGEGADELFGGYPRYRFLRKLFFFRRFTPKFSNKLFLFMKNDKAICNLINDNAYMHNLDNLTWHKFEDYASFYDRYIHTENHRNAMLNAFIVKDLLFYITPLLKRAELCSAEANMEIKVPYLNEKIIEFALNLPLKYKLNLFFGGKYILKRLAERYIPKELIYRKKVGLKLPLDNWLGLKNRLEIRKYLLKKWKEQEKII